MIAEIALPSPVADVFDYAVGNLLPSNLQPGCRVEVNFARRKLIGIVVQLKDFPDCAPEKLKPILAVLDKHPVFPPETLSLLKRAAQYYHHPLGEVMQTALPVHLRQGKSPDKVDTQVWLALTCTPAGELEDLKNAPLQRKVLSLLQQQDQGLHHKQLLQQIPQARAALKALVDKQLIQSEKRPGLNIPLQSEKKAFPPTLNAEQEVAVNGIAATFGGFQVSVLEGITGSGKTEVYLTLIQQILARQQQVLVLVPEISLTPQLQQRFQSRFGQVVANLHSGLNDTERLSAWRLASLGKAKVIVGTRSAVFTPMPQTGLIIVDEEHDASLKQQDNFRYHARDLAILRGQIENCPVVLGSATPSLESIHKTNSGQYKLFQLTQRAGDAQLPQLHLVDLRRQPLEEGLSASLLEKMRQHLASGNQVMLFLNRRGYAPVLMCFACGHTFDCPRCDSHMTYHASNSTLRCHHCGYFGRPPKQCPDCQQTELRVLGIGTQKLENLIQNHFPQYRSIRIDRDNMQQKHALRDALAAIGQQQYDIILGTQMLAKGHDFPNITLVAIIDVDQGLYSCDFRSPERLIQETLQVSGRAGRGGTRGEVVLQTRHPEHPLLQDVLSKPYRDISQQLLNERDIALWPPYCHLALFRAESVQKQDAENFLQTITQLCTKANIPQVQVLGPIPAPMERKANRFRQQLLLRARDRRPLHQLLTKILPDLRQHKQTRKVRWSVDVDPLDLS